MSVEDLGSRLSDLGLRVCVCLLKGRFSDWGIRFMERQRGPQAFGFIGFSLQGLARV
jgi:hypothetical protein